MHGYTHAGLGWAIGVAAPTSDRRLRIWCTAAAVLPDVDALTLFAGGEAFDRFHHTFGHNVFTGALCVGAAAWAFRDRPFRTFVVNVLLVAACFASHLLTDMKLSGWPLHLFWPLRPDGYQFHPNLQLGHPINTVLAAVFVILPWALTPWRSATPLEIISPRLDRLLLNLFRPRKRDCATCGRRCNNRCDDCTRPICLRHARVGWRFRVRCPGCAGNSAPKGPSGDGVDDALRFLRSAEAARLDGEFASFLDRKLTAGLQRLDSVPRSHPLWTGSDGRPTLAKVVDLCRRLLEEAPDDEEARWVLFADQILSNSADLGLPAIEPLLLRNLSSIRWLAAAARWSYVLAGVDPVRALKGPFGRLGKTLGSLDVCLMQLERDADPRVKEAASQCFELYRGRNPFKTARTA